MASSSPVAVCSAVFTSCLQQERLGITFYSNRVRAIGVCSWTPRDHIGNVPGPSWLVLRILITLFFTTINRAATELAGRQAGSGVNLFTRTTHTSAIKRLPRQRIRELGRRSRRRRRRFSEALSRRRRSSDRRQTSPSSSQRRKKSLVQSVVKNDSGNAVSEDVGPSFFFPL